MFNYEFPHLTEWAREVNSMEAKKHLKEWKKRKRIKMKLVIECEVDSPTQLLEWLGTGLRVLSDDNYKVEIG